MASKNLTDQPPPQILQTQGTVCSRRCRRWNQSTLCFVASTNMKHFSTQVLLTAHVWVAWLLTQVPSSSAFVIPHDKVLVTLLGQPTASTRQAKPRFATANDKEKDLSGLIQELNQQFDYDGRMEAKTDAEFRCGFVVIIGVSSTFGMTKSTREKHSKISCLVANRTQ